MRRAQMPAEKRDEQDREQDKTGGLLGYARNLAGTLRLHHDGLSAIVVPLGQALLGTDMAVGS